MARSRAEQVKFLATFEQNRLKVVAARGVPIHDAAVTLPADDSWVLVWFDEENGSSARYINGAWEFIHPEEDADKTVLRWQHRRSQNRSY